MELCLASTPCRSIAASIATAPSSHPPRPPQLPSSSSPEHTRRGGMANCEGVGEGGGGLGWCTHGAAWAGAGAPRGATREARINEGERRTRDEWKRKLEGNNNTRNGQKRMHKRAWIVNTHQRTHTYAHPHAPSPLRFVRHHAGRYATAPTHRHTDE